MLSLIFGLYHFFCSVVMQGSQKKIEVGVSIYKVRGELSAGGMN